MNILLFVLIFVLAIISYHFSHRNVFSPGFIICAVFSLSAVFVVLNGDNWSYTVSFNALVYLVIALALTLIGIYAGTKIVFTTRRTRRTTDAFSLSNDIGISLNWMIVLSMASLAVVYIYFRHQLATSISLGNGSGIAGMIYTLRSHVYEEENFQLGTALNIGISLLRAVGYTSTFLFINQLVVHKKIGWKYIIPVVVLIIYNILSTGRGGFIGFVCAILYDLYYSLKRTGKIIKPGKTVRYIAIGFIAFIILFWQLGKLTGKNEVLSFWDTMSIYIGSSILCFDDILSNVNSFNFIGTNSFKGIYNILARFGFNVTTLSNHADKIRWNGYSSNVFTAFYPYYCDYGPIVSMLMILIVGFIIGMLWRKYQNESDNITIGILYGRFVAGSTAMYSIAERLLSNTLALNAIVEIVLTILIIRICIKVREREATSLTMIGELGVAKKQ